MNSLNPTKLCDHREFLLSSHALLNEDDGIDDLSTYYWKVLAVDEMGSVSESAVRSFHTDNTNLVFAGFMKGTVCDAQTKEVIPTVRVEIEGIETFFVVNTTMAGDFFTSLPIGNYNLAIKADGYFEVVYTDIHVSGEKITALSNTEMIAEQAETPVISPDGGIYANPQTVSIVCAIPGALIRYTTNGTDPDETSPEYTDPVVIDRSMTVSARAYVNDMQKSEVTRAVFTITGTVTAPAFTPVPGKYYSSQQVTVTCDTEGAIIRYTLDGSDPTAASTEYKGTISVDNSITIKAKAYKNHWLDSEVSSGVYTITGTVASPTILPSGGVYNSAQTIALQCQTPGAKIYYTLDGSEPDISSIFYNGPIRLSTPVSLSAKAFSTDWAPSHKTTAVFDIHVTPGDISGDGNTDLADAILILRVLSSQENGSAIQKEAALSGPQRLSHKDALYILQKVSTVRD